MGQWDIEVKFGIVPPKSSLYAAAVVDDGHLCDWRNRLTKYSKLLGIRSLHDFLFVKNATNNTVGKEGLLLWAVREYHNAHCQWT